MATRKIKDAKDLSTNELIYFKGHAQATYMSDGTTVEDAINNISVSGGDGSSSSTYTWTWYGEDSGTLAEGEFEKIRDAEFLYIYMPHVGITALSTVKIKSEEMLLYVVHGIEVNEPVLSNMGFMFAPSGAFELERISYDVVTPDTLSTVATSGDYNDLSNKPTIPTESTVSGWGFTKNTGTVTSVKSNGTALTVSSGVVNIPPASTATYGVTKLSTSTSSTSTVEAATPSAVKAAYDLANSYKGTVTGVTINGSTKSPSSGTVDIGSVATSVKINGQSKSPSSGVVDLGYINKQLSTSTSSSMVIRPNMYYRNTSTSLTSLTITLYKEDVNGILNEYFVEFTTRASGTSVSLPSGIKWMNGVTPTFEAGTTYQISIVNKLGTWVKFK